MAIKVVYHACIVANNPRCGMIIDEHLQALHFSGLYDKCASISIFVATDAMDGDLVKSFFQSYGSKIDIVVHDLTWREQDTLLAAFDIIETTDVVLYLHSKGITRSDREAYCVDDWRKMMNYFLIKKHSECIHALRDEGIDTVGVNFESYPAPHFSGNFWWVRGDYFLSLPRAIGADKYDPEVNFLFRNNPKYVCLHHSKTHHYIELYPFYKYVDGQ